MTNKNYPIIMSVLLSFSALSSTFAAACPTGGGPSPGQVLQCGQVVTSNVTLGADLICPNVTGFALKVIGSGIVFNGNGHQIVAPQAAAGLYVQGAQIQVQNIRVNGVPGDGIFAYDSPALQVSNSNFSNNQIGILLYAENTTMSNVSVVGNQASGNSLFGIRSGWDTNGAIESPVIRRNDFSNSGSYAMYIQAQDYEVSGFDCNSLTNSLNGYYLKSGNFYIHDVQMSSQRIQEAQFFIDSALYVKVSNIDVSTALAPQPSQQHIGFDLYRVANFDINGLSSWNNDIGIKLETTGGVSPQGTIENCSFYTNAVAAVMVTSYDGTPYGAVELTNSVAQEVAPAIDLLVSPGTVLGAGSQFNFASGGNGGRQRGDDSDGDSSSRCNRSRG
ncbi:MAG: right-handed parallel beta-helix repeat-containing protein [Oligoflexia bacterium]|nr:right-handed parallel beta-helix repeat-containing protein [Oligoflexia bacterium]